MNHVPVLGLKVPDVTAWAGASPTSAGPGMRVVDFIGGLKGRNNLPIAPHVPPLQGGEVSCADVFLGLHPRLSHRGLSALTKLRVSQTRAPESRWGNARPHESTLSQITIATGTMRAHRASRVLVLMLAQRPKSKIRIGFNLAPAGGKTYDAQISENPYSQPSPRVFAVSCLVSPRSSSTRSGARR